MGPWKIVSRVSTLDPIRLLTGGLYQDTRKHSQLQNRFNSKSDSARYWRASRRFNEIVTAILPCSVQSSLQNPAGWLTLSKEVHRCQQRNLAPSRLDSRSNLTVRRRQGDNRE